MFAVGRGSGGNLGTGKDRIEMDHTKADEVRGCASRGTGTVLALGVVLFAASAGAEVAATADFTRETGVLRRELHSASWAPRLSSRRMSNDDANLSAMNLAYARTHDWALVNPGQQVIDYQHIFPLRHLDPKDPRNYVFRPSDHLIGLARGIGLDIFYRLGTSIEHTGPDYCYNARVPEDFDKTAEVFAGIVRHYNKGWAQGHEWNIKYWGIWCEPNSLENLWRLPEAEGGKDRDKMRDLYTKFFITCFKRLKSEFPEIKVGGPGLAGAGMWFLRPFLEECRAAGVAPDFVSWHYYGDDPDKMVEQGDTLRALCDEFGFPKCELILNEWHFRGCSWEDLRRQGSDPEAARRANSGTGSMNGIDAACFTLSSLMKFQRSRLDQAYYYGCMHVGTWGYMMHSGLKNKNWYALCLFGGILKGFRTMCDTSSRMKTVTALAAKSADGKKAALLVADYRGTGQVLEIDVEGLDAAKEVSAVVLSDNLDSKPCKVSWSSGRLVLEKPDRNSAAFLVSFGL